MLEIRWRELDQVVDHFVVLESDHTFTGLEKPLFLTRYLQKLPNDLQFAANKSHLTVVKGSKLAPGEDPFHQEGNMRTRMNAAIRAAGIQEGDILIASDVDEIPRAEVIQVFKWCQGMPDVVHLDMKSYIYSFGFADEYNSWRPTLQSFRGSKTSYSHGRKSDYRLMDSGWHCSFCFGTIDQFLFKMAAYSHAERSLRHPRLRQVDHIRGKVCGGQDPYDMLPEAYTFGDLLRMWKGYRKIGSGFNLPTWAVTHPQKWPWLMPGGPCQIK